MATKYCKTAIIIDKCNAIHKDVREYQQGGGCGSGAGGDGRGGTDGDGDDGGVDVDDVDEGVCVMTKCPEVQHSFVSCSPGGAVTPDNV